MPMTDSPALQRWRALAAPEWWERAAPDCDADWERQERAMEPERLLARPYRPSDQRAVIELLLSAQAAEPGFDWPGAGQLRAMLADPELDLAHDARLWLNTRGALVAFALLRSGGRLLWFARPSAQTDELDARVIAWAAWRACELADDSDTAPMLRTEARSIQERRLAALERLGFNARPGASLRLSRSLSGDTPLAAGDAPAGYRIRPLASAELGDYLALARQLFPRASRLPLSESRRRALMADRAYTPELDLVAESPAGTIVGFCHLALRPDERERLGRRAGWIEMLGVAPQSRRTGLARALVRAGLLALADYGADCALLTVRMDNAHARALYAAEGFIALFEERSYGLALG